MFQLFIVALIWGIIPVINSYLLRTMEFNKLMLVHSIVYAIAGIGMYGFMWVKSDKVNEPYSITTIVIIVVANLLLLGAELLYYKQLAVDVNKAVIISSLYPAITIISTVIMKNGTFSITQYAGAGFLVVGIILLQL